MNLYLKYRPKTIDELDLASVRKTLSDIVRANKVAHAYLLTGPRGAGKTSTARILARIVNCEKNGKKLGEPCNECSSCRSILDGSAVDVIEIDAASNRGIDDIRELKEKIRLAPAHLHTKVYIIDEVHMLTTEAFNALLKTLEEPPTHALFILCTTEAHKVPETIASRCVRIAFTRATGEEMVRSFMRVVAGEHAKADPASLDYLAAAVDGSFRDGVKILDQLLSQGTSVDVARVQEILEGVVGYSVLPFATALASRDTVLALSLFQAAVASGVDLTFLLVATMRALREALLSNYGVGENPFPIAVTKEVTELVIRLDEAARKLSTSQVPVVLVEMEIIRWGNERTEKSGNNGGDAGPKAIKKERMVAAEPKKSEKVVPAPAVKSAETITESGQDVWKKIIEGLNGDSYSLGALLAKARPGMIQGDTLVIHVQYDFHRQQLMTEKIRARLESLVSTVVGRPMRVVCEVLVDNVTIPLVPHESGDDLVLAAEEIFSQ